MTFCSTITVNHSYKQPNEALAKQARTFCYTQTHHPHHVDCGRKYNKQILGSDGVYYTL